MKVHHKKRFKHKGREKGVTLLSLVIAIFILILIIGVAVAILHHYIHRGKVGAVARDVTSIRTAVNSAMVKGDLRDDNENGDYLDDLIQKGYLSKAPSVIPGARYLLLQAYTDDTSGVTVYYLKIECSDEECEKVFRDLDKEVDQGDGPTAGSIQWVEGT